MTDRYEAAAHRMQSAVAFDMTRSLGLERLAGLSPELVNRALKDVRVGLNSAMSSQGGLAGLLIEKGLITAEEYTEAMCVAMEREADMVVSEVKKRWDLPDSVSFR